MPWVKTRLVEDGSMVQAIKTTHTLPVMSFFGFHHLKVSQRIFWVKQMNNCVTKTHTKTHSQLHAIVTLNNDESFTAWSWMFFFREKPIQSQTFKFINTQVELAQYLFTQICFFYSFIVPPNNFISKYIELVQAQYLSCPSSQDEPAGLTRMKGHKIHA